MRRIAASAALTLSLLGTVPQAASGIARQDLNSRGQVRVSPRATAAGEIDGVKMRIEYGSPFARGRVIWGVLRSWDQWWMPGADEATTMETTGPLMIGTIAVPAGAHSIYTLPGRERFLLMINRRTGQFHTEYTPSQDLGRTEMTLRMLETHVEQLTYGIESATTGSGGKITLGWDDREYSVPVAARQTR